MIILCKFINPADLTGCGTSSLKVLQQLMELDTQYPNGSSFAIRVANDMTLSAVKWTLG